MRFTISRLTNAMATSGMILAMYLSHGLLKCQGPFDRLGLFLGVLFENGNGGGLDLIGMASGMLTLGASAWLVKSAGS
ncbi:MAG: hypothetical protein NVSMB9_35740 [Isosphaeraceae bacterium]